MRESEITGNDFQAPPKLCAQVVMTLAEEAQGINPLGEGGLVYTRHDVDLVSALAHCRGFRDSMITASARNLEGLQNVSRCFISGLRPFTEADFILTTRGLSEDNREDDTTSLCVPVVDPTKELVHAGR